MKRRRFECRTAATPSFHLFFGQGHETRNFRIHFQGRVIVQIFGKLGNKTTRSSRTRTSTSRTRSNRSRTSRSSFGKMVRSRPTLGKERLKVVTFSSSRREPSSGRTGRGATRSWWEHDGGWWVSRSDANADQEDWSDCHSPTTTATTTTTTATTTTTTTITLFLVRAAADFGHRVSNPAECSVVSVPSVHLVGHWFGLVLSRDYATSTTEAINNRL